MALDRQSIEKKDFPIGRRGYDQEAVDAHLRGLADEIEELERSARRRGESLSAAASEQVRSIVEAAETTASDIRRQAEDEARKIRADARSDAQATREQAAADARDSVGKVAQSTTGMRERIDAMENELGVLIESLRTGSDRLKADLQLLEGNLASVEQAAPAVPAAEPFAVEGGAATGEGLPIAPAEPAPAQPANGTEDESARLIALNMVMNNTPREEIERYLAEHFRLTDRRRLLDDVYSSFQN